MDAKRFLTYFIVFLISIIIYRPVDAMGYAQHAAQSAGGDFLEHVFKPDGNIDFVATFRKHVVNSTRPKRELALYKAQLVHDFLIKNNVETLIQALRTLEADPSTRDITRRALKDDNMILKVLLCEPSPSFELLQYLLERGVDINNTQYSSPSDFKPLLLAVTHYKKMSDAMASLDTHVEPVDVIVLAQRQLDNAINMVKKLLSLPHLDVNIMMNGHHIALEILLHADLRLFRSFLAHQNFSFEALDVPKAKSLISDLVKDAAITDFDADNIARLIDNMSLFMRDPSLVTSPYLLYDIATLGRPDFAAKACLFFPHLVGKTIDDLDKPSNVAFRFARHFDQQNRYEQTYIVLRDYEIKKEQLELITREKNHRALVEQEEKPLRDILSSDSAALAITHFHQKQAQLKQRALEEKARAKEEERRINAERQAALDADNMRALEEQKKRIQAERIQAREEAAKRDLEAKNRKKQELYARREMEKITGAEQLGRDRLEYEELVAYEDVERLMASDRHSAQDAFVARLAKEQKEAQLAARVVKAAQEEMKKQHAAALQALEQQELSARAIEKNNESLDRFVLETIHGLSLKEAKKKAEKRARYENAVQRRKRVHEAQERVAHIIMTRQETARQAMIKEQEQACNELCKEEARTISGINQDRLTSYLKITIPLAWKTLRQHEEQARLELVAAAQRECKTSQAKQRKRERDESFEQRRQRVQEAKARVAEIFMINAHPQPAPICSPRWSDEFDT